MRRSLWLLFICALLWARPSESAAADSRPRPTVAVLYFDYAGPDDQMAVLRKGLAQMLISDLSAQDAATLVERSRLEEVLAELKLNQTAHIDPKSASKLGKLLGARYLVLGSYFVMMNTLRADARLVEVETGKVLDSTGKSGPPEDFLTVEQALSAALTRALVALPPPPASGRPAAAAKPPAQVARVTGAPPAVPKPPAQLKIKTAVRYSKALDALDHGKKDVARTELSAVTAEQPDFRLATLDLDRLLR